MILDHRRMRGLVAISIMLILAACSPTPDRSSPIVQKAKDAGAGDLTTAQNAAMYAPNKPKKKSDGQTFEPGWK